MKKFLAILLTLSVLCSLIVIPASAATYEEEFYIELDSSNIISFSVSDEAFVAEGTTPTEATNYPVSNLLDGDETTTAILNHLGRSIYWGGHSEEAADPAVNPDAVWDEEDQYWCVRNQEDNVFLTSDLVIDLGAAYNISGVEFSFITDEQLAEISAAYPERVNLTETRENFSQDAKEPYGKIRFYKENPLTSSETPFEATPDYQRLNMSFDNGLSFDPENEYRYVAIDGIYGNYSCFLNEMKIKATGENVVLFDKAKSNPAFDYSDLSGVSADEFTAANIQTGAGSIKMTASAGSASITKIDDSTFKATTTMSGTVGAAILDFVPDTVKTDAVKSVMEFKFKPSYVTATGEKVYSNNPSSPSYIRFSSIGVKPDGNKVHHRATQWNTGSRYDIDATEAHPNKVKQAVTSNTTNIGYTEAAFSRGAGSGANMYSEGQFSLGADGYYYIKLESYENASGQQFAYSYDMNAGGAAKGYHRYDSSNGNHAETLGHGFRFEYSTSSKDNHCVLAAEIKDVKMYYEYAAIGSITTAGSGAYTYDAAENSYRFYNKPASGASGHMVKLNSGTTLSTGYVAMDFSLKKEDVVYNEGNKVYGNAKQIQTASGTQIFTINPASTTVGAFNTAGYYYNVVSGFRVNAAGGNTFVANGDWYDLRIVAVNGEEGGTWDYAVYDKNSAYGLDKPIMIKSTVEKTFTGFAAGWYLDSSGGRAAMSTDSTKAQTEYPITIKNLSMYSTENYSTTSALTRELYSPSGSPHLVWTKDSSGNQTAVRWDGTLFVSTTKSPKAILAVYDSEGNEIKRDVKDLANGIYEFGVTTTAKNDARGAWTVDLTEFNTSELTAKMFFFDGKKWVTDAGEYEDSRVKFTSDAQYGWANEGDEAKTLRFYFVPDFSTLITPDSFGAYVIPFNIFSEDSIDATNGVLVDSASIDSSMTILPGEEYGVDLEGVDKAGENVTVVAKPFIKIGDEYLYGDKFSVKPIDVLAPDTDK